MNLFATEMDSPVGKLVLIANDSSVVGIAWGNEKQVEMSLQPIVRKDDHALLLELKRQLGEYFNQKRISFDIPIDPIGTDFQKKVWRCLLNIPFGNTKSYQQIAMEIGMPKASRAVGAANGKNPISIVIPCHRVIGSNGQLVGFAGGMSAKKFLLALEKRKSQFNACSSVEADDFKSSCLIFNTTSP